jgi:hypothetical protein
VGLLDHRGRRAGRGDPRLRRGLRPCADAARVGVGVLAVQAPLQDAGRAAERGARVQAPRAAAVGDRHRLLPLDPPGRLEVRPGRMAGPRRDGGRARGARRQADGVHLADGEPGQRELRGNGRPRPARDQRARPGVAAGQLGPGLGHAGPDELLRRDQPPGQGLHLVQGQGQLPQVRDKDLVAGRLRARARARAAGQPPLPHRPRPGGRQRLPDAARPRLLRGHAGRGRAGDRAAVLVGLGRQPALRRPGLVRRHRLHLRGPAQADPGRAEHRPVRHPLVDHRHRRVQERRYQCAVVPRAHRPLVPVRRVLPGVPAARDPPAWHHGGLGADRRGQRGVVVRRDRVRDHPPSDVPAGTPAALRDGAHEGRAPDRPAADAPAVPELPRGPGLLGYPGPVPVGRRHPRRPGGHRGRQGTGGIPAGRRRVAGRLDRRAGRGRPLGYHGGPARADPGVRARERRPVRPARFLRSLRGGSGGSSPRNQQSPGGESA